MFKNAAPSSDKVLNAASSHRQRQKGKDQRDKRELNSLTTIDPFFNTAWIHSEGQSPCDLWPLSQLYLPTLLH